jgi:hypothetical protein
LAWCGFAAQARADWTQWLVEPLPQVFVTETANASSGPNIPDRCNAVGGTNVDFQEFGEVYCQLGGSVVLMNRIETAGFASVAMDAAPDTGAPFVPPYFAIADLGSQQIWYGVAGQTPVLAVQGSPARSLSLAHFADGTPYLVYRGLNDRIYTATRKPTGEWSQMQLTNNQSGTANWSVDAVIKADIVHIAYWDSTWNVIRYARRQGATWTFETAKDLTGSQYVAPAVAADEQGRAYIAYGGRDGVLHYLRRTAANTWVERTYTPPQPISLPNLGPVGFTVDSQSRAHFVYGTGGNGTSITIRYVNTMNTPSNNAPWQDATILDNSAGGTSGYYGIDLARKNGSPVGLVDEKVIASWASSLVGVTQWGCADCIP